jgi:dipeptidyl-peptidase-4
MPETPDPLEEFPRQVARTRGFSLGVPRAFTVSPTASASSTCAPRRRRPGQLPVGVRGLGAKERLVFDPGEEEAERDLTDAERARRERARERSSGCHLLRDR